MNRLGLDLGHVIWWHGHLMPGFRETWEALGSPHFTIITRTHRDWRERPLTDWTKHVWQFMRLVRLASFVTAIHPCHERAEKAFFAERAGITHFVDDRLGCLEPMARTVPHRFALNPGHDGREDPREAPPGIIVARTWEELRPEILKTWENL